MDGIYSSARKAYELAITKYHHTEELQEVACKDPYWAYAFARDIKGADIGYCQKMACKEPMFAYCFARYVRGADIEYCQEAACKDPYWAYAFARDVDVADLDICFEAVRGTEWEGDVRKLVIEKVVG